MCLDYICNLSTRIKKNVKTRDCKPEENDHPVIPTVSIHCDLDLLAVSKATDDSISIKIKTKHQMADCKFCAFYDL
jgi:hypothetical protein